MTITSNPLSATFDAFQADLSSSGACAAIDHLAVSLAQHRAVLSAVAWQASCAAIAVHPAVARLLEDPYSRDARTKPAGYAGDARTLDYVYLQDPGDQPLTETGRALFHVSTGVPIAAAVRDRCAAIAAEIACCAAGGQIRVASIACGHARELDRLNADLRARVRFWGMDHDAASVDCCRTRFASAHAAFVSGSVRDVIAGRVRIPPSDLIFASGLFDYLDQRTAALLVTRMFASLNVGGTVLVPNLTPRNDEVAYMEAVMDWWMCYRTEADMRELAASIDSSAASITVFTTSAGRVAWLRIERVR